MVDPSKETSIPIALSSAELEALRLLSSENITMTADQVAQVQVFLASAVNNATLNEKLRQAATQDLTTFGVTKQAIDAIKLFSEKSRDATKFTLAFAKLGGGGNLTLEEYSIIVNTLKIKKALDFIQSKVPLSHDLAAFAQFVEQMPSILSLLEDKLKKEGQVRPGAVLFDSSRLTTNESWPYPYIFNDLVDKKRDISPKVGLAEERKSQYLYADDYFLKVEELISPEHASLMQSALGQDWQNQLNSLYEEIQRQVHDEIFRQYAGMPATLEVNLKGAFAPSEHATLLCPEFMSLLTQRSLMQLETKVKELAQSKNVSMPDALINMPFSAQENILKLTPAQTLQILNDKGCLGKAPSVKSRLDNP